MLTKGKTKMSIEHIIHQIDKVIRDTNTPRQEKIESLKQLAITCWREVAPELENAEILRNIDADKLTARWAKINDKISNYETKGQILYVLEWPASGGNFYWIK